MSKPTFSILGDIVANDGERWWESDVVPGMVIGWLNKQDGDIEININSNGGDVAGGLAIANAIKAYSKGKKTCNVLGVAASMASVIACAGDELKMGQGAFLMVHNPWTVTMGNAEELRKDADTLDKMRDSILSFYQSKSYGKTADDLKALMDAETWLSADEARAAGFLVDDYAGEMKAAASLTRRAFAKAPDAAKALIEFHDRKPASLSGAAAAPASPSGAAAAPASPSGAAAAPASPSGAAAAKPPSSLPEETWEARFRGLSRRFDNLQSEYMSALAAVEANYKAKLDDLQLQLDQSRKDLEAQTAKFDSTVKDLEQLRGQAEENAKALLQATDDLAATRDSLATAEEQVKHLESTRDALTAGVLTPPAEAGYAEKMESAKTPEEREALRNAKRAGKIK